MQNEPRIPQAVADAILANRKYFHELNARAQQRNAEEAARLGRTPQVQMGFDTRPLELSDEWQFWTIADDDVLDDFLTGDLLPALYGEQEIDWSALPAGYAPLIRVLEFERHCDFEGWTAVSNRADEMQRIISAYRQMGLEDEARALTAVTDAYVRLANDEHEDFHDILGEAYGSVPNATPESWDRTPLVLRFVRENPALFHA